MYKYYEIDIVYTVVYNVKFRYRKYNNSYMHIFVKRGGGKGGVSSRNHEDHF